MTQRQQWLTVLAIVIGVIVVVGTGAYVMRDELFPVGVGTRAPGFTARTVGPLRRRPRSGWRTAGRAFAS